MRKTLKFSRLLWALLFVAGTADAAGLGRLSVHSALGQPLKAEIELRSVNKDELATITARLAGAEAFKQAHIDRGNVLNSLQFSVDQRANGQPIIRVTSSQPIADPFIDMLIELDWTSGRVLREYTILLDPPSSAKPDVAERVTPPAARPTVQAPPPMPAPVVPPPAEISEPRPAADTSEPPPPIDQAAPAQQMLEPTKIRDAAKPEPKPATDQQDSYGPVKSGETLRRIAAKVRPDSLTLEQMIVGLYQANQTAFSSSNMNLLKRGQVLVVPDSDSINLQTSPAQAHRIIQTHAAKWQVYRRKVAEMAGEVPTVEAPSAATGKLSTKAPEVAPPPATAPKDVLRVSKGEPAGDAKAKERLRAMEEDAAAKSRALQESNDRVAHLERTVRDMEQLIKLKASQPATPAAAAQPPAAAPAAAPVTPPPAVTPPPTPTPKPPPAPVVVQAPVEPADSSWFGTFISNPLYIGGIVAALALSVALWMMMVGTRRRQGLNKFEDSIMTGGEFNKGTAFGSHEDAAKSAAGAPTEGSMLLTDFSRLGLGSIDTHEVDPIAEAEVYMAYGRDAQAEEILKEALNKDPSRHEIALKLLEIYAARKDNMSYETVASELYASIGGQPSQVWVKAAEMGRGIDPTNPLYRAPPEASSAMSSFDDFPASKPEFNADFSQDFRPSLPADDDFDFPPPKTASFARETPAPAPHEDDGFDMSSPAKGFDFGDSSAPDSPMPWDAPAKPAPAPAWEDDPAVAPYVAAPAPQPEYRSPWQSSDDDLDFGEPPAPAPEEEMPVLDLSGIDLELDAVPTTPAKEPWADEAAPLEFVRPAPASALRSLPEASDFAAPLEPEVSGSKDAYPAEETFAPYQPAPAADDFASFDLDTPQIEPEPALDAIEFEPSATSFAAPSFAAPAAPEFDEPAFAMPRDELAAPAEVMPPTPTAPPDAADAELWEEVNTKLDLARAYLEMGDKEGAREILQEVMGEGDTQQKTDADKLLAEAG